jgi:hypothetical protein
MNAEDNESNYQDDDNDLPLVPQALEKTPNGGHISDTLAYKKAAISLILIRGLKPTSREYNMPQTCPMRFRK